MNMNCKQAVIFNNKLKTIDQALPIPNLSFGS